MVVRLFCLPYMIKKNLFSSKVGQDLHSVQDDKNLSCVGFTKKSHFQSSMPLFFCLFAVPEWGIFVYLFAVPECGIIIYPLAVPECGIIFYFFAVLECGIIFYHFAVPECRLIFYLFAVPECGIIFYLFAVPECRIICAPKARPDQLTVLHRARGRP